MTPIAIPASQSFLTPDQLLRKLHPNYEAVLKTALPVVNVALLVSEYIGSLGRNGTNWYTALQKIDRLPSLIPALPENIFQIFELPCPILGNQCNSHGIPYTINDTHSLYLLPKGKLKEIIPFYANSRNLFYINNSELALLENHILSNILFFKEHTWVVVFNNLLPNSCHKTVDQQAKMIDDLRKTTSIDYKFPDFKYIFAANMLNNIAKNNKGAFWISNHAERGETRTLEVFPSSYRETSLKTTLTVGNYNLLTKSSIPYIEEVEDDIPFRFVGITPIWIGFSLQSTQKKASTKCCAIS